jgi:hypothetical protein
MDPFDSVRPPARPRHLIQVRRLKQVTFFSQLVVFSAIFIFEDAAFCFHYMRFNYRAVRASTLRDLLLPMVLASVLFGVFSSTSKFPLLTRRRFHKHLMITKSSETSVSNDNVRPLVSFGTTAQNSLLQLLKQEPEVAQDGFSDNARSSQFSLRVVNNVHFTRVEPEPVPAPRLVGASESCARALGIDPSEIQNNKRALEGIFSGNELPEGLNKAYCTNYGCHCYGTWFGQVCYRCPHSYRRQYPL